jgi:hypothetical protein
MEIFTNKTFAAKDIELLAILTIGLRKLKHITPETRVTGIEFPEAKGHPFMIKTDSFEEID